MSHLPKEPDIFIGRMRKFLAGPAWPIKLYRRSVKRWRDFVALFRKRKPLYEIGDRLTISGEIYEVVPLHASDSSITTADGTYFIAKVKKPRRRRKRGSQ